jgi:hypothetical protein
MFEIHVEWEESPGVKDPLLAQTWARLEFRLDGRPMTRYLSERARSVRSGVYGSVFPLAQWVADNWWFLLYEGLRHPSAMSSARAESPRSNSNDAHEWLLRHNLFMCREGMAYPDLTIVRQEDRIALRWFADPATTTTQGRFIDEGVATVGRAELESALEALVVAVLERIEETHEESADDLVALWAAIVDSRRNEAKVCARLAMLGQDPYAECADEALEDEVNSMSFSDDIVQDLLSASTTASLSSEIRSARELLARLPATSESHAPELPSFARRAREEILPYKVGYSRAAEVRSHLGLSDDEPLLDLQGVMERLMGGAPVQGWLARRERTNVEAAVQVNGVAAVAATERSESAKRFLLARALHHWLYAASGAATQRLLTKGQDWLQAASRAFSAELLAPARALSNRLASGGDWEQQEELAQEFNVNPKVIWHQVENHGLD